MSSTSFEVFRNRVLKAVRQARSKGWRLEPGIYINRSRKRCCPLAASLLVDGRTPAHPRSNRAAWEFMKRAARTLLRSDAADNYNLVCAFAEGFDGRRTLDPEFWGPTNPSAIKTSRREAMKYLRFGRSIRTLA